MARTCLNLLALCLLLGQFPLGSGAAYASNQQALADLRAHRLRCEYLTNPLGIDEPTPRLSWALASNKRGQSQTSYQILVASSKETLAEDRADLWDTGQVDSRQTTQIAYSGKKLRTAQRVYWKVRSWDQDGNAGPWSETASWEMGILDPSQWSAEWIGRDNEQEHTKPLPLFRKGFRLSGNVQRARVYLCGLGYHELHLNGKRIGARRLSPGYTRYDKRLLYDTFDATDALQEGANAIGVMLGNGWYNVATAAPWNFNHAPWRASPRLLCELWVEYEDGREERIVSDDSWKTTPGPITYSSIYGGESYDARREQPGWSTASFDDTQWSPAKKLEAPLGELTAFAMPPIRFTKHFEPARISKISEDTWLYDFGQNMSGCVELSAAGNAGDEVQITYSELLGDDGRLDRQNIGVHVWSHGNEQRFQTDSYTLKGDGPETWVARFTYHGFRYAEVTAPPAVLEKLQLKARVCHTDFAKVGSFECSNTLLNQIWKNACWSYLSNYQGIPTDCPHREKNGWTGDAHLACEFGLLNYDSAAAYTKWIVDLQDEQQPEGSLPGIVPTSGWGYAWGNGPAWDSAYLLIPEYLRVYCGDTRLLDRQYEGHKKYVDYLESKSDDLIINFGLGDWAPWKTTTPEALTSTAYFYRDALIVADTAERLGRKQEAQHYRQLAERIREAFNVKYWDRQTGGYRPATQTALSCAIYQGLADSNQTQAATNQLLARLDETDDHIDTGILGAKYLLPALSDHGNAEVAYRVASQETQPSWGWWIKQGATTLWEQWTTADSHNHIMYGDVAAWFAKTLAGLNPDPQSPGFQHVIIRPQPVGDLQWAKSTHESLRGTIELSWRRSGDSLSVEVNLPANVTATVYLPTSDAGAITEAGVTPGDAEHVSLERSEDGIAVLRLGSGSYRLECPYGSSTAAASLNAAAKPR